MSNEGPPYPAYKVAASKLSHGNTVLDHQGWAADVKWYQIHCKKKRLVVDLYTKDSMLTVTGTHRIVTLANGDVKAKELKAHDKRFWFQVPQFANPRASSGRK